MANKSIVSNTKLDAIADAIKAKDSSATTPMTLDQMATAIAAIPSGGGGGGEDVITMRTNGTDYEYSNEDALAIPAYCFYLDEHLTNVHFEAAEEIGEKAFVGCIALRGDQNGVLTFPAVRTVRKNAFGKLQDQALGQIIQKVVFPALEVMETDAFTAEANMAFYKVQQTHTLDIGDEGRTDVIDLQGEAFCMSPQILIVRNNSVATLGMSLSAYYGSNITTVYVNDNQLDNYKNATNWSARPDIIHGISEM